MCDEVTTRPVCQGARPFRLEPTARAAREARRFVSTRLTELGHSDLVDDATLIASELVTNSLAYAPRLPIWVGIWQTGAFLDLEVWDCSPQSPVYMEADYLADGGRGLHIVKELAISTGYATFDCGKVVWALMGFKSSWAPGISWIN
jgi:anti-sigma regulatory factor (Ser/Thr protein kinase)